jgi:hypothetical protein
VSALFTRPHWRVDCPGICSNLIAVDLLGFHSRVKTLPAEFAGNVGESAVGLLSIIHSTSAT